MVGGASGLGCLPASRVLRPRAVHLPALLAPWSQLPRVTHIPAVTSRPQQPVPSPRFPPGKVRAFPASAPRPGDPLQPCCILPQGLCTCLPHVLTSFGAQTSPPCCLQVSAPSGNYLFKDLLSERKLPGGRGLMLFGSGRVLCKCRPSR